MALTDPNNPVTRAELAVVGLRGLGVTQATIDQYAKNPFIFPVMKASTPTTGRRDG